MKILLTGGTGYIGSHTAVELISRGHEVEILDNLINSKITALDNIEKISNVKPKFYFVDLLDKENLDKTFKKNHFDLVIHFAGLKSVAESIEQPLRYYENNIGGTINLLEVMKKYNCKRLVFSSSATVYGNQDGVKLTEDSQTGIGITNPYGETKFMIEQILQDLAVADPEARVGALVDLLVDRDGEDVHLALVQVGGPLVREVHLLGADREVDLGADLDVLVVPAADRAEVLDGDLAVVRVDEARDRSLEEVGVADERGDERRARRLVDLGGRVELLDASSRRCGRRATSPRPGRA